MPEILDNPTSHNFASLPPFPSDVPTAPLLRLNLQKLLDHDASETDRLWEACKDIGFFYLDLQGANDAARGIDGDSFLRDADQLFGVSEDFFALPVAEKQKYDFKDQGSYFGYKGYGAGVVDKKGTTDRNEFYNVSKDDILSLTERLPAPAVLDPHRALFKSYITTSHAIISLVLDSLDRALHFPPNTLASLHRLNAESGDQVRFVRAPPQPEQDRRTALGAHTDFGSVTLLFNRLGGLQILPPGAEYSADGDEKGAAQAKADAWQYVKPLPGHCIVNLGDAMVKFTRGVLRSNIHRVVNPPGEQGGEVRLSLVYFSRPEDKVLLRPLQGSDIVDAQKSGVGGVVWADGKVDEDEEAITSKEWILRRALGRRGVGDWEKSEGTEAVSQRTQTQAAA